MLSLMQLLLEFHTKTNKQIKPPTTATLDKFKTDKMWYQDNGYRLSPF